MVKAASKSKSRIRLNVAKVKRVQKVFGAKTETEAIERALDFVIEESRANRLGERELPSSGTEFRWLGIK
ncbi:MAG: hypothetical protein WA172_16445 [Terriglobales bacterium]